MAQIAAYSWYHLGVPIMTIAAAPHKHLFHHKQVSTLATREIAYYWHNHARPIRN